LSKRSDDTYIRMEMDKKKMFSRNEYTALDLKI
jgi:hypothetical protein